MDDYISRKALIEHIKAHCSGCDNCGEVMHCAWDTPAADVVPVRHGRWIKDGSNRHECSECHKAKWVWGDIKMEYCEHCGAKMDEEVGT